jgi:hypothetical protein
MSQPATELTFRDLADAEPGIAVLAGLPKGRFLHALKYGHVPIDLITIPEDCRLDVYNEIVALIRRRSAELRDGSTATPEPADPSN